MRISFCRSRGTVEIASTFGVELKFKVTIQESDLRAQCCLTVFEEVPVSMIAIASLSKGLVKNRLSRLRSATCIG